MDRFFRLTRLLCFCLFAVATSAFAGEPAAEAPQPPVVLSSGAEGGGYWNAATRMRSVAADRAGLAVDILPSTGSLENIEKLLDADSPVNLAFVQADAAQFYLDQHHGQIEKLDLLESIGQECVFIMAGVDSGIRNEKDLHDASDLRLGIASPSSGVAATFNYMVSEIPAMADIEVSYGDTAAAMEQLTSPEGPVDAVMVVHRPRAHSQEVDYALAHSDRIRFVELNDELFLQGMWNGDRIYRTMKLAMPEPHAPVQTLCVRGLLLANKQKLSIEQRNKLGDLMLYHWMEIYPTQS
ncbi:MAG: hypothetical protein KDI17_05215 [Halioglobus sp.]|nr:hypothetical protein [Halioglobus sp.]